MPELVCAMVVCLRTMKMRYDAMYIESSQIVLTNHRIRRHHTNFQRLVLQTDFSSEDSNPRLHGIVFY